MNTSYLCAARSRILPAWRPLAAPAVAMAMLLGGAVALPHDAQAASSSSVSASLVAGPTHGASAAAAPAVVYACLANAGLAGTREAVRGLSSNATAASGTCLVQGAPVGSRLASGARRLVFVAP